VSTTRSDTALRASTVCRPTMTIVYSLMDAGQMNGRHDRPIADFKDTELSSNITKDR